MTMRWSKKEHNPPHIHAFYANFSASYEIKDYKINGLFPPKQARIVLKFIEEHREELLRMWDTQNIHKIRG